MVISKRCTTVSGLLLASLLAKPALADVPAQPAPAGAAAADPSPGLSQKFSVLAGLSQWLLFRGGNLAVEYKRSTTTTSRCEIATDPATSTKRMTSASSRT